MILLTEITGLSSGGRAFSFRNLGLRTPDPFRLENGFMRFTFLKQPDALELLRFAEEADGIVIKQLLLLYVRNILSLEYFHRCVIASLAMGKVG